MARGTRVGLWDPALFGIVGSSPSLVAAWETLIKANRSTAPVHISGETGTGKELFAQALHRMSARSGGPFVAINCAALATDIATSELFGHCRGAFTGAVSDRKGIFEEADGGTVFLDEIAEMRAEVQAKLLRVLETREVRRVGGSTARPVDIRIVSATNRSLRKLVEENRFRADLLQRFCAIEVRIPPLRCRKGDIIPLARHLLSLEYGESRRLSPEAESRLHDLPWNGNVRELKNAITRAGALSTDDVIGAELFDPAGDWEATTTASPFRQVEVECYRGALATCGGSIRAAADLLKIPYSTLRARIIRVGLDEFARSQRLLAAQRARDARLRMREGG